MSLPLSQAVAGTLTLSPVTGLTSLFPKAALYPSASLFPGTVSSTVSILTLSLRVVS